MDGCWDAPSTSADLGNSVIVVEHDEETIRAADHIIDLGPVRDRAEAKL